MDVELVIVDDEEQAAQAAAERLAAAARRGGHIALSGGSTPGTAYELAAKLVRDWSKVDIWLGDERCVPIEDERSNLRLVQRMLVERAVHPPRVHPVDTSLPAPRAARAYNAELDGVVLTLAFQGIGPDGHTASLYPEEPALAEREARAVATAARLQPWVDRVTMTIPMLCAAEEVVFLVVGEDKADAARRAFAEPPSEAVPASLVRSASGPTVVILDAAAAGDWAPRP